MTDKQASITIFGPGLFAWLAFFFLGFGLILELFSTRDILNWVDLILMAIISFLFFYEKSPRFLLAIGIAVFILKTIFPKWVIFATTLHQDFIPFDVYEETIRFLEHTLYFFTPLLLWPWSEKEHGFLGRVMVSFTFVCHGLFALGVVGNVPDHFIGMVSVCLPWLPDPVGFLQVVGWLDCLAVVCMWVGGVYGRIALMYMVIWGFLTALARPWSTISSQSTEVSLMLHSIAQMLVRMPHSLIPLSILWIENKKYKKSEMS